MATPSTTAADWNVVRSAFASSIMVDTALSSLAENLDGPVWPSADKVDTPATYIDLDFADVQALMIEQGYPPETLDTLVTILQDTLAFDDPFGDMVDHSAEVAERENPIVQNLEKLGISQEFPIELTQLDQDTKEFCELEKLRTLGEFATFAQGMAQNVIVGGDFRALLNSLSHVDEVVIAQYLPYRRGEKGLHLIEAVGLVAANLSPIIQTKLQADPTSIPAATMAQVKARWQHFEEEARGLESDLSSGGTTLDRAFLALNNPEVESTAIALLRPFVASSIPAPKRSWWARLLGR